MYEKSTCLPCTWLPSYRCTMMGDAVPTKCNLVPVDIAVFSVDSCMKECDCVPNEPLAHTIEAFNPGMLMNSGMVARFRCISRMNEG